jgi:hypothetical protein
MVLPLFFDESYDIDIHADVQNSIRLCENLSQKFDRLPFIAETAGDLDGFVVWAGLERVGKKLGIQYELQTEDIGLTPTYEEYSTLSTNAYPSQSYFCAYHFNSLKEQRRNLITELVVDNEGEIILGGNTRKNSFLREINEIYFFDNPKRYKTSEFNVSVDVLRNADRESYINNVESIKLLVSQLIDLWKPATSTVRQIIEKETLVMAQLLKDEFTQVLVGITPRSNTNAFYIRSSESGQITMATSSNAVGDVIDWIGVGTSDTPYLKSGVLKIKEPKIQTKVYFETRFLDSSYRIFVFTPNNNNYFVTSRDKEGFIVESSSFVENEIAWIALQTNQIVNGTLNWTKGLPKDEPLVDHLERQDEVNINSSRYTINLSSLGFPDFEDTNYSVILTPDSNVNLWVENKTASSFDIRRSYAGNDTQIHYMAVKGNSKWWQEITA